MGGKREAPGPTSSISKFFMRMLLRKERTFIIGEFLKASIAASAENGGGRLTRLKELDCYAMKQLMLAHRARLKKRFILMVVLII